MKGDYIKREDAVKAAQDGADEWDGGFNRNRDVYIEASIDSVPAADVHPVVRGKWETVMLDHVHIGGRPRTHYCSECNHIAWFRTFFCPNCGADMRDKT